MEGGTDGALSEGEGMVRAPSPMGRPVPSEPRMRRYAVVVVGRGAGKEEDGGRRRPG